MRSSEINLTTFRQILLLPLTLTGVDEDIAGAVHDIADKLGGESGWTEQKDHLAHLGSTVDPFAYSEFVYFHAYIQDFLYDSGSDGKGPDGQHPLRLFQRTEPGDLVIDLNILGSCAIAAEGGGSADKGKSCGMERLRATLSIERMNLYIFELGVAILAVEVALKDQPTVELGGGRKSLTLAHELALQNALRRIYPPYFSARSLKENRAENIPQYPASLRWSKGQAQSPRRPSEWIAHVAQHRRNPIDSVWKEMLAPLVIEESSAERGGRWRQIIDERIPSMIFVGVRDDIAIERSDFVRLCFMDDSGESYPYAKSFLESFEQDHCYDRFWFGDRGTRYMFSGYSMVVFGTGDPGIPHDFFHGTVFQHFRRHYFQVGLLLQMQLAALLSLSHRVSEAVKERPEGGAPQFQRQMLAIKEEMLAFEQRYWFSQISNQVQAREIYQKWIEKTGMEAIYSEVRDQILAANAYLDDREQAAQTTAATRLSVIATFGVIVGAAFAFLGMNVLVSPDFLLAFGVPKDLAATTGVGSRALVHLVSGHLAVFFCVLTASSSLGRFLLNRYSTPRVRDEVAARNRTTTWRLHRDLGYFAIGSLVCAIVFILAARLST